MISKIRRVLMTADTIGGVWIFAVELIKEFEKLGVQVVLAVMGKELNSDQKEQLYNTNTIIEESSYKLEWMQDPWSDVEKAGKWLLKLEEKYLPEVIHLNEYSHAILPWEAPVVITGHSCIYSWFNEVKGVLPDNSWGSYYKRVQAALDAADCVVAPTKTMMSYLDRFYGPLKRKKIIYNGRNSKDFNPSTKKPVIFSAGRLWDEAKNIQSLARIAPSLNWPVYVAGDYKNPDKEEIHFENVNWLGIINQNKMGEIYGHSSIYVLPAKYEPFGLSVLEAALSGCALVLGGIDSLIEVWNGCAVFVDPDDDEELSAVINELISDEEYRRELSSLAFNRAMKFSSDKMAAEYLNTYYQLKELKKQAL